MACAPTWMTVSRARLAASNRRVMVGMASSRDRDATRVPIDAGQSHPRVVRHLLQMIITREFVMTDMKMIVIIVHQVRFNPTAGHMAGADAKERSGVQRAVSDLGLTQQIIVWLEDLA